MTLIEVRYIVKRGLNKTQMRFVKVAVPGPFLAPLDYVIPDTLETGELPVVGGRVWVPFRRKVLVGLVMDISDHSDLAVEKIKPLEAVIDADAVFSDKDMQFLRWASHYYHEPIGQVVQTALPKRLRGGEPLKVKGVAAWQLSASGLLAEKQLVANAPQQRKLWALLQAQTAPVGAHLLKQFFPGNWRLPLKRLQEKNWVSETEMPCVTAFSAREKLPRPGHILHPPQQAAVDAVLASRGFGAFLLEGVTGSGKTEVYLEIIQAVIAKGRQALVLVPEIGLTPQTVRRFEAFLQTPVAVMHSGLNDKERHCAWSAVKHHEVSVLLGTRSALFTPFADLGLCILDEEHDLSFKQQEGFRYSARDCLVRRARLHQVPVVLGSATPSIETLHNALAGRYQHLRLLERAGTAQMPTIQLLDVRGQRVQAGVSEALQQKISAHLAQGNQVLLFLNRRGYAPVLMCHQCGWQAVCSSCDANMTYHQQINALRCHHCGAQQAAPRRCPDCGSADFEHLGVGTEQLQRWVQTHFPQASFLRIDRDTTRLKGQMQALTEQASHGEADILIGTQMLAKGHHFPKVTLVAMLDIDQGLFSCDFRAAERMAQLVIQVAGRSGRGLSAGEVVIQTHHPEHLLLKVLVESGYPAFAQHALAERQQADLPPFQYQILLRAEALDGQLGWLFLNEIKQALNFAKMAILLPEFDNENRSLTSESSAERRALSVTESSRLAVLGPVSAPMLKRQGRFRYQLLLQGRKRSELHQWLAEVEGWLYQHPLAKKVRWSIDVDPQEMT